MVKALDLSSNGRMSAWVRTPLLVKLFFMQAVEIIFKYEIVLSVLKYNSKTKMNPKDSNYNKHTKYI